MVLLVNANTYKVAISKDVQKHYDDYYRIKNYARQQKIHTVSSQYAGSAPHVPNGLLRLATILKFNGIDSLIVDFSELENNLSHYLTPDVSVIGFSAVTPMVPSCAAISQMIKSLCSHITVAIGGAHVNVAKNITMRRYPCFDKYIAAYDLNAVSQLVGIEKAVLREPPCYVDYSLLPMPLHSYQVETFSALGCIYTCDYCQDRLMPYFENRDTSGILDIIPRMPKGRHIHFVDSSLGVKPQRTKKVCEALSRLDHGFLLSCDLRAEFVTPDLVQSLVAAGFVEVNLGMESSDEDTLRFNNRFLPHSRLRDALKIIRDHSNLYVSIYSAIGIPSNTVSSLTASRYEICRMLENREIDELKHSIYVPYPMDGKDYAQRGVRILNHNWSCYDRQSFPVYELEGLTADQIWENRLLLLEEETASWLKGLGIYHIDDIPKTYWNDYVRASSETDSRTNTSG